MKKIYSIATRLLSISVLLLLAGGLFAQSKARVENVDFNLVDENLVITYDIAKSKSGETFNVKVNILTTAGKNISAFALTGDIGPGVSGGEGKKIIWDLNKDNVYIDDEISVEVLIDPALAPPMGTPEKSANHVSIGGALLRSAIFPGWGNRYVKGGGAYWLMGIAGYGAVGGAIFMNNKTANTFEDYQASDVASERDQLFEDAQNYQSNQNALMYTAAAIWAIDLIWTGIQAGNANKRAAAKVDVGYYYNPVAKKPMVSITYKF